MRKKLLCLPVLLLLVAASSVECQEHSHPINTFKKPTVQPDIKIIQGKVINFPSLGGANASGYLSLPAGKSSKHPALIVIQEWWGVNPWIMEQADRFAKQGYVALAVDLYRGKVASDPNMAHELMRGLPEDRANADLQAGFKYLAARPDVDSAHIGVIGWCMGGGYALNLAIAEPRLAASVINYGHLANDHNSIAKIKSPILGNFGALDRGIPAEDVKAFDAELKKDGKTSDIKIYEGAGHAFMNPNNKEGYAKPAADDAWLRIDGFLAKRLRQS